MPKAKAASPETTAAPSSGTHGAHKAATRRKVRPKFELPDVASHPATDWAFRDGAEAPSTAVVAEFLAASHKPLTPPLAHPAPHKPAEEKHADIASPWAAPTFIAGAMIGGATISMGLALLTAYAAIEFVTAPARIARKLL